MRIRIFTIGFALCFLCGASAECSRLIVIGRDNTNSFKYLEKGDAAVAQKLIPNLGPNDRIVMIDLGNFSTDQVKGQAVCPVLPEEIWQEVPQSPYKWRQHNRQIRTAWERVAQVKTACSEWIQAPQQQQLQKDGYTEVHRTLGFLSTIFESAQENEKYLILYSDLVNTQPQKSPTRMPPKQKMVFEEVHVTFLFVPWEDYDSWQNLKNAWRGFFADAASFLMLDPASSQMIDNLIPESDVPRRLEAQELEE